MREEDNECVPSIPHTSSRLVRTALKTERKRRPWGTSFRVCGVNSKHMCDLLHRFMGKVNEGLRVRFTLISETH